MWATKTSNGVKNGESGGGFVEETGNKHGEVGDCRVPGRRNELNIF